MSFTKKSIKNMPYYDDKVSEHEIMSLNQYERVFDCGNDKWELIIQSVSSEGEPYYLYCGLTINCSIENMKNFKFCGVC